MSLSIILMASVFDILTVSIFFTVTNKGALNIRVQVFT